jgi:predicted nucleotidyltransferase
MDTPESDFDYRGIFVAEPINIRTPFFNVEECKDTSEEDTVIYELNQFMKLAVANNPNVIEGLWTNNDDIVFSTPAYEFLRSFAPELLTAQIAFTTSGYACAQLKRLQQSKKQVNYLPDLKKLCETLQQALQDNLIDEQFIIRECGQVVLDFMITKNYIS